MPEKFAIYYHFHTLRAFGPPVDLSNLTYMVDGSKKTRNLKNIKNVQNPLKNGFLRYCVTKKSADLDIFSSPVKMAIFKKIRAVGSKRGHFGQNFGRENFKNHYFRKIIKMVKNHQKWSRT